MQKKKLPIPIESLRYIVMLYDGKAIREISQEVGKSRQAIAQSLEGLNRITGVNMSHFDGSNRKLTLHGELLATESRQAVEAFDAALKVISAIQSHVADQEVSPQ